MSKQGKRIPRVIRNFVSELSRSAPSLSQREIAAKVQEQFGEDARIEDR